MDANAGQGRAADVAVQVVGDVARSVAFCADLLGVRPVEQSARFARFALANGRSLGLRRAGVPVPAAARHPGVSDPAVVETEVAARHAALADNGTAPAGPPVDPDFGRTLLAFDPDGNRLRFVTQRGA